MSHCSNREEALARKGQKHIDWLESNHWRTFYDKKRFYPDAEERQFDDIPEVDLVLVRLGYKRIGGRPVKARFIKNTCILSTTRSELQKYLYTIETGMYAVSKDTCYKVEDFHFNQFPKYPILTLSPITESKHLRECFNYVMGRVAKGLPVQYTLPH